MVATETVSLLQLESFLPYRLAVLSNVVARGLAGIQGRHGLGAVEWITLMTLGEAGPMTATALGTRNRMHKTRVSRAVASLMHRDLIVRTPSPTDLRKVSLRLSPLGRSIYEESVPLALDFASRLSSACSPEEQVALERGLARLAEKSRQMMADPFEVGGRPRAKR